MICARCIKMHPTALGKINHPMICDLNISRDYHVLIEALLRVVIGS